MSTTAHGASTTPGDAAAGRLFFVAHSDGDKAKVRALKQAILEIAAMRQVRARWPKAGAIDSRSIYFDEDAASDMHDLESFGVAAKEANCLIVVVPEGGVRETSYIRKEILAFLTGIVHSTRDQADPEALDAAVRARVAERMKMLLLVDPSDSLRWIDGSAVGLTSLCGRGCLREWFQHEMPRLRETAKSPEALARAAVAKLWNAAPDDVVTAQEEHALAALRRRLAIAAAVAVGFAAAGGGAWWQRVEAVGQRDRAASALRSTEQALMTAAGRNADLLASRRDDRGAVAAALEAVLPHLDRTPIPDAALRGLWRAVDAARRSFTLSQACDDAASAAISDDGRWLATVDVEGRVSRTDTDTLTETALAIAGRATTVALDPTGERTWVGTAAGELWIVDLGAAPVRAGAPCAQRVTAVETMSGGQVAVACADGAVAVVTSAAPATLIVTVHPAGAALALRSNERWLLVIGPTGSWVYARAAYDATPIDVPILLAGEIDAHDRIVGVNMARTLSRGELRDGHYVPLPDLADPDRQLGAVGATSQGDWIVGASARQLLIWSSLGSGDLRGRLDTGHPEQITLVRLAATGRRAVSYDVVRTCRVWRLDGDGARLTLGSPVLDPLRVPFDDDAQGVIRTRFAPASIEAVGFAGHDVLTLRRDGQVQRWRDSQPTALWQVAATGDITGGCVGADAAAMIHDGHLTVAGARGTIEGPWATLAALTCAIDGHALVVTAVDRTSHAYDLDAGRAIVFAPKSTALRLDAAIPLPGPNAAGEIIAAWAFDRLRAIVAETGDGELWSWTPAGWHHLAGRRFTPPTAVALSPDARVVAAGNDRGEVWVWFVATGELVVKQLGASGPISSLAWSADSRLLVAGSLDGGARVYAASTTELVADACRLLRGAPGRVVTACAARLGTLAPEGD